MDQAKCLREQRSITSSGQHIFSPPPLNLTFVPQCIFPPPHLIHVSSERRTSSRHCFEIQEMQEHLSILLSEGPFFPKRCTMKVTGPREDMERQCFQGRAYSHRGLVFPGVKLPLNDTARLCWRAGDKKVPSGISCHSFSSSRKRSGGQLPYIYFSFSPVEHLSSSFGWIENSTTTKAFRFY